MCDEEVQAWIAARAIRGTVPACSVEEIAAAGFEASRTGFTFTSRKPLPDGLVTRLAQASRAHAGS